MPLGLLEVEAPRIYRQSTRKYGKINPTHRPPLPSKEISLVLISVRGWVDLRGHGAAGRIMSLKNPKDTIGNRSGVPQPTVTPRVPIHVVCGPGK